MSDSIDIGEELKKRADKNLELFAELEQKNIMMQQMQRDLNEARSQVTIAQCTAENEVAVERRKCQEEIATVQQLTKEELSGAYEEIQKLQQRLHAAETETYHLRARYAHKADDNDSKKDEGLLSPGVLSAVTKSIVKHVPSLSPAHSVGGSGDKVLGATPESTSGTPPMSARQAESLEESMIKAQESATVLKSLVVPLEEEIRALKIKLREQDAELRAREAQEEDQLKSSDIVGSLLQGKSCAHIVQDLDRKLQEVESSLHPDQTTRGNLELYAAILNTQKASLKDHIERQRDRLTELRKMYDDERKEHRDLRNTWEKANDQFLENQRMHLADTRKVRSILTVEQARKLYELQQMDSKEEAYSANVSGQSGRNPDLLDSLDHSYDSSNASVNNLLIGDKLSSSMDQLKEASSETTSSSLIDFRSDSDKTSDDMKLEQDGDKQLLLHDSPTESGSRDVMYSSPQQRVITEHQWNKLQEEIRRYQKNVSHPCLLCAGHEAQLKKVESELRKSEKRTATFEGAVNRLKHDLGQEATYRKKTEAQWKDMAEHHEREVKALEQKVAASAAMYDNVVKASKNAFHWLQKELEKLTHQRDCVYTELKRLEHENDSLVGKHSQHSQAMQNEIINLPDSMEEMQLLLLKYREDVISAKVAKEQIEESLRSEILFLKDQVSGEQHERSSLENKLTSEIDVLREKAAIGESLEQQLDTESKVRTEIDKRLRASEQKRQDALVRNQQLIGGLKTQVEEHLQAKAQLERTVSELRNRISSLQQDLKTSEVVQRDFVRLSQSLQVQLEAIRQSEQEVRWQHEEDIDDCHHCKQKFTTVGRRKHHCRHCGRLFCSDCVTKVVHSGPNRRASKVCDVCHTLLVNEATPFFSTEPPHSPD